MDVKTLCLGVLTEGDRTGYEIKQRFEEAFNHFFGAGFGSIYPALAELTRRGLVTCESVEQEKRPDKKVYSLTPAGRKALVDELVATPPRHKVRSEFLVLMYFAHLLPPERVAEITEQMVAHWRPVIEGIERCVLASDAAEIQPGMRFAAGFGRAVLGAAAAYVDQNRQDLVAAVAGRTPGEAALAAAE
ncbi:MAG TPA: PadR family transcriptional regulator [Geminicoccaceae bacterium]